MINTVL